MRFPGFAEVIDIRKLSFGFKNPVTDDNPGSSSPDIFMNVIDTAIYPFRLDMPEIPCQDFYQFNRRT